MKQSLLFTVPPQAPTPYAKLQAFKLLHGILTERNPNLQREEHPWIAIIPHKIHQGWSIAAIMADECRLYEEAGYVATGEGELSTVRTLCAQLKIECPL